MMERPDRDREPPHKRRKSTEEKGSVEEREGHRGGAAGATGGKAKDGGSAREHRHLGSSTDSRHRSNHCFKDGSRERGWNGAGNDVRRENSRDKDAERTKAWNKDRQRKDSAGRDETPNRGRTSHEQGGHKDSQNARSRTQTPKTKPESEQVPTHKPNPWFKDRGAEEQGGYKRTTKGPEGQLRDRSSDGGRWTEPPSQPRSTTVPSNPWQVAGANMQPPPPGTCPSDRRQEDVKLVKCKITVHSEEVNSVTDCIILYEAAKHFPSRAQSFTIQASLLWDKKNQLTKAFFKFSYLVFITNTFGAKALLVSAFKDALTSKT